MKLVEVLKHLYFHPFIIHRPQNGHLFLIDFNRCVSTPLTTVDLHTSVLREDVLPVSELTQQHITMTFFWNR